MICKNELTEEEARELDDILTNYILLIKDELIEKQQYTTENIEKLAIIYLKNLFNSVKSFEICICKRKSAVKKDIQASDVSKKEFKNAKTAQLYKELKKYYIFVTKILKKYEKVSKDKVENLAIEWVCNFLRMEAYKISLKSL